MLGLSLVAASCLTFIVEREIMEEAEQVVSTSGLRADGRGCEQVRAKFFTKPGVLSRANGSAYAEVGDTKVMVAVHGPKPSDGRRAFTEVGEIVVNVQMAAFSGGERVPVNRGSAARSVQYVELLEEALCTAVLLEKYPKAVIEVHAVVLEVAGSVGAALAMAAGLAICDAGIHVRDVISASSLVTAKQHMLVDPTAAEERVGDRSATCVMLCNRQRLAHMDISGVFTASELTDVMELSVSACAFYDQQIRQALEDHVKQKQPAGLPAE